MVINCGSTNTRLYLIKDQAVISKNEIPVGVNSTAATGNNAALKEGIAAGFQQLLAQESLTLNDVCFAIASGIITSNLGLVEIPHLTAPVNIDDLATFARQYRDPAIFPIDIPVVFIPGIKNAAGKGGWEGITSLDLMRGAIGVLSRHKPALPCTIIELGSTTKLIHIDAQGRLAGNMTSLSGQVYAAVLKETFIGSSVKSAEPQPDCFSEQIADAAYRSVQQSGLLRTILLTRFIQFSLDTQPSERKLFCEAAMAADDMKLFADAQQQGFDLNSEMIFVGNAQRCHIYQHMMKNVLGLTRPTTLITARDEIDRLVVEGAGYIAARVELGPQG
ncbi:2-dehydro-3-deoxygalactonokinase [Candidatus Symbiopectobacterium sp. 'North America']|uniref:2-dehydro-3-deoxygalactonokinase n=1 Tax=Candidatus Symbiopectobacterium sp. 'North America' TaxID=2794574 RepID=UPI0018C9958A|nr:2-dehydro-3-deoxygalactonokinase [Candidatus Symbiopectobacterium sp. 'North America']